MRSERRAAGGRVAGGVALAAAIALSACGGGATVAESTGARPVAATIPPSVTEPAGSAGSAGDGAATGRATAGGATGGDAAGGGATGGTDGVVTATEPPAATDGRVLAGRTVVIDPGHNGANGAHPAAINRLVAIGNGRKPCNTTGTTSVRGLNESRFNWLVAIQARRALRALGATVVLTRQDDRGVGPCVDRRARIANANRAAAAVSIHADGGPPGGRGFHVILPGRVPQVAGHDRIVAPSERLGRALRAAFRTGTGSGYATYLGRRGLDVRTDLGGLNLARVPAVMIESGNMRNAADAARMSDPAWRRRAGRAIASGIRDFLLAGG